MDKIFVLIIILLFLAVMLSDKMKQTFIKVFNITSPLTSSKDPKDPEKKSSYADDTKTKDVFGRA